MKTILKQIISVTVFLQLTIFSVNGQNSKSGTIQIKKPTTELTFKMNYKIQYPVPAAQNGIQGDVILLFDIDSTCSIVNRKVATGIGYGCDEEALKILDLLERDLKRNNHFKCEPSKEDKLPISFKLK